MAMTKCRECGRELSTTADACPHCGAPQKRLSKGPSPWTIIGWIVLVFLCLLMYSCYQAFKPEADARRATGAITAGQPAPGALSAKVLSVDCDTNNGRTRATVHLENTGPEIRSAQMFLSYVGDNIESAYGSPSTIPPGAQSRFSFVRSRHAATACEVTRLQDGTGHQVTLQ